ncbi:hypothetical protein HMPREF1581_01277 [Gardnerella vaginalis JCP8108]|uniref:Uncharacterized protein n=1 Tax=Gardnerella vaginalis JCP8108 TaxID=1261066 RepID=S4GKU4_GARVA|nr:hypothetical protein HMPREF1581_01277 [Gardnerella vaginalis JCP8108]
MLGSQDHTVIFVLESTDPHDAQKATIKTHIIAQIKRFIV